MRGRPETPVMVTSQSLPEALKTLPSHVLVTLLPSAVVQTHSQTHVPLLVGRHIKARSCHRTLRLISNSRSPSLLTVPSSLGDWPHSFSRGR